VKPDLHVVAPDEPEPPILMETVGAKARRLQAEAQAAARKHVLELMLSMSLAREHAREIAEGGDCYPAGIRSIARCIVEDLEGRAATLTAIVERTS